MTARKDTSCRLHSPQKIRPSMMRHLPRCSKIRHPYRKRQQLQQQLRLLRQQLILRRILLLQQLLKRQRQHRRLNLRKKIRLKQQLLLLQQRLQLHPQRHPHLQSLLKMHLIRMQVETKNLKLFSIRLIRAVLLGSLFFCTNHLFL